MKRKNQFNWNNLMVCTAAVHCLRWINQESPSLESRVLIDLHLFTPKYDQDANDDGDEHHVNGDEIYGGRGGDGCIDERKVYICSVLMHGYSGSCPSSKYMCWTCTSTKSIILLAVLHRSNSKKDTGIFGLAKVGRVLFPAASKDTSYLFRD